MRPNASKTCALSKARARRIWLRAQRLETAAPFLAWRALVLACPRFYPGLEPTARGKLLDLADRALAADAFDPAFAEVLFA